MAALLEHLNDRQEASYLVTELATQIVTEESDVTAKLQYIDRLVRHAKKPMMAEDAERMRVLLLDPDTAKYFTDPLTALRDGSYIRLAAISTETHLRGVASYVAASSVIFAHSFLEYTLDTLLKISRLCDIQSWLVLLGNKTVAISSIVERGSEAPLEEKLREFVASLRKEGLLRQVSLLATFLKRSISQSGVINYTYDPDRVKELDDLRHTFAHHRKKEYTIEAASSDVTYLYRTAFHFLDLTVHRYDLYGAHRPKGI
jgi:hypothetical protein